MGKYVGKNALTAFWNGIKAKFSNVAFSGDYDDLINKPTLGTASSKNVSSSGDASSSQVVMGNDSRLTDARPASDVSSWAKKSTKPTYTASEVGLGNVGNFKAVSTVASQGLSSTEQSNARANIGAGTSSFSGSYNDLSNKPTLGTAAAKDVASSGNASTSQVVMGNDTRLSNARPASDVSSWAKKSTKPTYTKSEVGLGNVGNFKAVSTVANQGLTDTEKRNARINIGANGIEIVGNFAHYESTATASRAYAVGEHLTYNGYLYRVIADISIGSTISPGTNVMQTTVGDEIQGGKIWIQAKSISNTSGSSGTLCTITDPLITSDHVLTKFVAANRTVITSDVSCTTSPGQAVLTGVSTATTTAEIMLERPDKVL